MKGQVPRPHNKSIPRGTCPHASQRQPHGGRLVAHRIHAEALRQQQQRPKEVVTRHRLRHDRAVAMRQAPAAGGGELPRSNCASTRSGSTRCPTRTPRGPSEPSRRPASEAEGPKRNGGPEKKNRSSHVCHPSWRTRPALEAPGTRPLEAPGLVALARDPLRRHAAGRDEPPPPASAGARRPTAAHPEPGSWRRPCPAAGCRRVPHFCFSWDCLLHPCFAS